ncbi:MAG: hypothetical protein KJN71_09740, partial [Acidimicrobiia bacterium]|nr:hypothetical protein [Acidimicrobiia bacterium]
DLSDAFTLGNSMGIGEAITLAWSMRDIGNAGFSRFKIPVTGHVTTTGAQVLLPTEPFPVVISEYYPDYQASAG